MNKYKDFCYEQLETVLSETNVSDTDFEIEWSTKVAAALGLNQATLLSLYSSNDAYNTNSNTRAMWKYTTSKGVSGTPSAFVNGVPLDNVPSTVAEWVSVLNAVYAT